MAATSCVDSHPQRAAIISAINAGASLRSIAALTDPPIHHTAIARYKRNLALQQPEPEPIPVDSIDKAWAEQKLVRIIKAALGDAPLHDSASRVKPDLNIARAALRDLYEANGWMAPKRTESLNLNLHAMPPAQLAAALRQTLSVLPASARAELAAAEPDLVEIVGEVLPPAAEVGNQTRESE